MEGYICGVSLSLRKNVENAEFDLFSLGFIFLKLMGYGFMLLEIYRIARRR